MKLTEMLGQYEELLDKKDQLAKDTKDNNAAIDKLKAEIAEMMIDEDIPSQGYGDYIYSLQDKVKYSKRGEAYTIVLRIDTEDILCVFEPTERGLQVRNSDGGTAAVERYASTENGGSRRCDRADTPAWSKESPTRRACGTWESAPSEYREPPCSSRT